MSRLSPISWNELIRKMHALGFKGPYTGKGPHRFDGGLDSYPLISLLENEIKVSANKTHIRLDS